MGVLSCVGICKKLYLGGGGGGEVVLLCVVVLLIQLGL